MPSGFKADCRDFSLPAAILRDLRIKRVRLLSNNPRKASALIENGIEVVAELSCEAAPNPHSIAYLRTKKERMGHALTLRHGASTAQAHEPRSVRRVQTASEISELRGGDHDRTVAFGREACGIEIPL